MLLLLAATAPTPLEKLGNVSGQFWLKIILAAVALTVLIFIFKKIAGMNKIILGILICVLLGIVGVNWIYERNEPSWMTPIIEPIADSGFFPTKGAYGHKQQQQDPGKPAAMPKPGASTAPAAQPTKK